MPTSTQSLNQTRFTQFRTLRALAIGLAIGMSAPVFADNLPEVQRLIKAGQYPQAMEKVDAYLNSRPKDAQGRFLKGLIYTEMNKLPEAIGIFTKLTEDYPELPEPYNNLAVLYAQQKQYDKARNSLEMAIRTHPSYAIAYENLGDIYAKLASQAYDKALQLDSSNTATQNKLALIRDLITPSTKGNVKPAAPAPTPAAPAPATVAAPGAAAAKPVVQPNVTVVASTPGAAATSPTKVAEPKPAPASSAAFTPAPAAAPAAAPAKPDHANEDVAKAIAAWASAWSRKDMKAYLSAYAADFNTPKGIARKAWETERTERIAGKAGKISVDIEDPQISVEGDKATARFRQHYKAPGLSSSSTKTLVLVRAGSKWLIKEENAR